MLHFLSVVSLLAAPPGWTQSPSKAAEAAGRRPVLVLVHAAWCEPCNKMENEVLATSDGERLLQAAAGASVDFDTPAGDAFTGKYGVLELPTFLVLAPDGTETGRVEGYSNRAAWLAEVEDALAGKVGLAALSKQYAATPGDLELMLAYAKAKLVRGEEKEAEALLRRGMVAGGTISARAARIWGRWLIRVRKDGPAGTAHFLEHMQKHAGEPVAGGFLYWAAQGYVLQGKRDDALKLFDDWIARDPRGMEAHVQRADFMLSNGYEAAATKSAIQVSMALDPESAAPHYLLARCLLREGDRDGAKTAILRALDLDRRNAMYRNFARRELGVVVPR